MPKVDVKRDELFKILGKTYTQEEFEVLCFEFGIELDEVTSEAEMIQKETGEAKTSASSDIIYKIDIPANRYDLLCIEGISRALLTFLGKMQPPKFITEAPKSDLRIIAKPETLKIRPVVVGAILRDVTFTPESYASFIDLQEKLHQNICRKRTLVSIGTHDLDTVKGPFTYEALKPEDIKFAPLNMNTPMNGAELFTHLDTTNSHLKKYLHIIKDSPIFPVIYDSNRVVLSLPPIINGDHSKITLSTKNVFIEITATDRTKANIVLNTVVTMFSQYSKKQYSIEKVEIQEADGTVNSTPDLSSRTQTASVKYIKSAIGVDIADSEIAGLLNRMSLPAKLNGDVVSVEVPATRSDILHECDIMEDVAIAYGFNTIPKVTPKTPSVGRLQPINKVSDLLRDEIAHAGYTEVLAFTLCSLDDNFKNLNRPNDNSAVIIANPKTAEFQCGRLSLLSGILKSVRTNKAHPLPIKVFEVGDAFMKNEKADTGSSNKRLLTALYADTETGFEVVHGLLDRLMVLLRIPHGTGYNIKPSDDPAFFPGRRADIFVQDKKIGVMGLLHPEVLRSYSITYPCSAIEIEITVDLATMDIAPPQKLATLQPPITH